jgi:HlyD family secretion protein
MIRKTLFALCIILSACSGRNLTDIQTVLVKRGTFSEELTEEGNVKAVNSIAITAPNISYRYGALKIAKIAEEGKEVKKGDTLIIFDPSEIKRAILQSQQQLEIAVAEYEKLKATQNSEIEDLESDLEMSRISQEISKINFEQAVYESDVTRKEINLKLETSNIALARAKENIENKKKIQKEELFQKSITIKQLTTTLNEANNSIKSLFVVSPSPGIVIKGENWGTGQKWNVSDQPFSGSAIIDLPDLNEMMAEVKINEVDVSKVVPGQKVEIRPDAYSDSIYTGVVSTVANLAQNKDYKSKIKIFPVKIKISGKRNNLLPGLTVSCRIIIKEVPDVLYIPLEALFKEMGSEFVYVKSGSGFKRRDVKTGATNTDFAIITEGVSEKVEVALSDPFLNKEEKKKNPGSTQNPKQAPPK